MSNLTSVGITNGVPTSGTGTVSTIDALMALINGNGTATSANSSPVVIASNQATIAIAQDTTQIMNGVTGTALTPIDVKVNISTATTTNLVAAVGGKKIRIISCYLIFSAADNFNWQSHTTTSNGDAPESFGANSGLVLNFHPLGWFDTTIGEGLDLVTSTTAQVSGRIKYVTV